jgi:hypothetical protein
LKELDKKRKREELILESKRIKNEKGLTKEDEEESISSEEFFDILFSTEKKSEIQMDSDSHVVKSILERKSNLEKKETSQKIQKIEEILKRDQTLYCILSQQIMKILELEDISDFVGLIIRMCSSQRILCQNLIKRL